MSKVADAAKAAGAWASANPVPMAIIASAAVGFLLGAWLL